MKFLILLLISFTASASYLPKSKVGSSTNDLKIFSSLDSCEGFYSEKCFEINSSYNPSYFEVLPEEMLKEESESCVDDEDCGSKFIAKDCSAHEEYIKVRDALEVFCGKFLPERIEENSSLKAAQEASLASAKAMEDAIALAEKAMTCGKRVQALLAVRNQVKGLTTSQMKDLVSTYSDVKNLLDTGSLVTAKEEIQAKVADGTLVTEGDKTALVAEIDKCLGL